MEITSYTKYLIDKIISELEKKKLEYPLSAGSINPDFVSGYRAGKEEVIREIKLMKV